jgi:hypothetical protein
MVLHVFTYSRLSQPQQIVDISASRFDTHRLVSLFSVTVAVRSKTCTVFARSEAVIVGSNPTQSMDVWFVYAFILCLCCPVFR